MSRVHVAVLPAVPPFALSCSLRAMAGFAPCRGDQVIHAGTVRKAFPHPADPLRAVVVEVGEPPDGVCGVRLTVHAELSAPEAAAIERAVDRWLGLSDDRSAFLTAARADPALAGLLEVAEGLHQVRFATLAEGTAFFTLTQRSTQWFAAHRKRRIVADFGPHASLDGVRFATFPPASLLLCLGPEDLTRYAGGPARAGRLHDVLAGVAALDEEWLRAAPFDDAREALLAIPGVGPFTALSLLTRVLGRPDEVPLEMEQFTRSMRRLYGDPPPAPADLRARYGATIGWWSYTVRTASGWVAPTAPDGSPAVADVRSLSPG